MDLVPLSGLLLHEKHSVVPWGHHLYTDLVSQGLHQLGHLHTDKIERKNNKGCKTDLLICYGQSIRLAWKLFPFMTNQVIMQTIVPIL